MNKPAAPKLVSNLSLARKHLARFEANPALHLIGGEAVASRSGETFESLDPTSNAVLCRVAAGNADDIDRAAIAAAAAFETWSRIPGSKRRTILHAIADNIVARAEEIALVESSDTGQA